MSEIKLVLLVTRADGYVSFDTGEYMPYPEGPRITKRWCTETEAAVLIEQSQASQLANVETEIAESVVVMAEDAGLRLEVLNSQLLK